jgi:hypothetical protein
MMVVLRIGKCILVNTPAQTHGLTHNQKVDSHMDYFTTNEDTLQTRSRLGSFLLFLSLRTPWGTITTVSRIET